jgi:hypothetical protein
MPERAYDDTQRCLASREFELTRIMSDRSSSCCRGGSAQDDCEAGVAPQIPDSAPQVELEKEDCPGKPGEVTMPEPDSLSSGPSSKSSNKVVAKATLDWQSWTKEPYPCLPGCRTPLR